VLGAADADIGQIAYEMTLLVNRVGEHLAVGARQPDSAGAVPWSA
jgi:hypothetical protein